MLGDVGKIRRHLANLGWIGRRVEAFLIAFGKSPLRARFVLGRMESEREVRHWFTKYKYCNIMVCLGKDRDLVVLDVDFYKDGPTTVSSLGLPSTPRTSTGDGEHYYFRHTGSTHLAKYSFLGKFSLIGNDYNKANLPPSMHSSGNRYSWLDRPSAVAPLPPSLSRHVEREPPLARLINFYKILRYKFRTLRYSILYFRFLKVYFHLVL